MKHVGALGSREVSDVLELQLNDSLGFPIKDEEMALSLAVLLRNAASEYLGVEPEEMGFAAQRCLNEGHAGYSIILFDRASGGAGYSSKVIDHIGEWDNRIEGGARISRSGGIRSTGGRSRL